jgi:hypothetical protein
MRQRLRSDLTYANVISTLALFLVLGGGTAVAAYVVSSNSQIGPGTVSGHKPPTGYHANIVGGSVNGTDIADKSLTGVDLNVPASFHSAGLPNAFGGCGFINGWADWSPDVNQSVGYYRTPNGFVHLQGTARPCGTGSGPYPMTLPAGYRPQGRSYFVTTASAVFQPEVVFIYESDAGTDAGKVAASDSNAQISLDGISFRCGPSGQNGCP